MADRKPVTRAEMDAVAHEEIRETFRALGVDINDQRSLNEFRADLVYARQLRKLADSTKARVWLILLGIIVVGLATALWRGVWDMVGVPK